MIYRWLTEDELETLVNPVLKSRGYAELNINREMPTCRVLGAFIEETGELIESFTLQLYPVLGPLLKHNTEIRDSGEVSRQMATIMYDFLVESKTRDFLVMANSPVSRRLCERFGMKTIGCPVYMTRPGNSEPL